MAEMPTAWANLIEALTLLAKHQNNDISPTHCGHDTLTVCADPTKFTAEELARLDDLGFFPHSDGDAFMSFTYGSA
jgi:hypothetical protein